MEEKYVYVVFSHTNTGIGKAIRKVTKNEYNHASISLDGNLRVMYSFARYHVNTPFIGGFVSERPLRYLADGNDIKVKVARVPVSASRYYYVLGTIDRYSRAKNLAQYNSLSALSSLAHHRTHIRDAYTCVEFAASMVGYDNICVIRDLETLLADYIIAEGSYRSIVGEFEPYDEDYFEREKTYRIFPISFARFCKLIGRKCTPKKDSK